MKTIERMRELLARYPEPWLIEKEPHSYTDGTKEFTHVRYRKRPAWAQSEEICVEIGSHVTPDLAELLILLWENAETALAEIERLRAWVADLQSGLYVNCVYCGHRYGPGETTPVSMADALKAHVAVCPEHPMAMLLKALQHIDKHGYVSTADFDMVRAAIKAVQP